MRHSEYERRRRALEKQLQEDLELIRAGHRAKLHALEVLWLASPRGEESARDTVPQRDTDEIQPPSPPPEEGMAMPGETQAWSETQDPSETQEAVHLALRGGLVQAVRDVLPQLPEVFDKHDLMQALGFEPRRATLARALERLVADQQIKVDWLSIGRLPTRYRKVAGEG